MKTIILLIAVVILFSTTLGCGYHIMGKGEEFPEGITSVAIIPLDNKTVEPNLTSIFTSALRHEFIFRHDVEVVPEEKAEASLQGSISSIKISSSAYDLTGRAAAYDIFITLDLRLIRRGTNAILWKADNIQGQWHYNASYDAIVNEGNKTTAIQKIAADLAEKIYIMIKERF
jgi:outer membrane lipopolysaccharide assembly protein LptE/RlpB